MRNSSHYVKEANPEGLHAVGFQLHDVLEKSEFCRQGRAVLSRGWRRRGKRQNTEDLEGEAA